MRRATNMWSRINSAFSVTRSPNPASMLKRAGLPKIRLHDSRHTTFSLMEKAGVPISIISKWAGHYDSSFKMKTYVHASDKDLEAGRRHRLKYA